MNFETPPQKIENKKQEVIRFPQNMDSIRALQDKLQEYKERIDSPDRDYKVVILERLLTKGIVDKQDIILELKDKFGQLDEGALENAYGVIEDYVKTGGAFNKGGTGLKLEKQDDFKKIESAKTFEELYEIIKSNEGLDGSRRHYSSEELIEKIENFRKGGFRLSLQEITRTDGLRDKVEELFNKK